MAEENVTVVATFKAKAGMEIAVKSAIEAAVAPTRSEPGCINYDLHQSAEDPALFMLYENWRSKKDLDEHLTMPHLKNLLGIEDDLLKEPIGIALWQMISKPAQ